MKRFSFGLAVVVLLGSPQNLRAAERDSGALLAELRTVLTEEVVTIQSATRKWNDNSGNPVVEGILQRATGDVILVKGADGTITEVDRDTLCEADQSLIRKAESTKMPSIYFPVGKRGLMRIRYMWPRVFVLQDTPKYFLSFLGISYREGGEMQSATGGFLKVDGEVTKLTVESTDDQVLNIEQGERPAGTGYLFRFLKAGIVMVKVTIGDRRVHIPIQVIELPVTKGTPVEDVIEKLGLPKKKEIVYCSWPESEREDSIFYSAEAGKTIAAQHWEIEKHDWCVLSMVDGKVYDVGLDDDITLGATSSLEMENWWQGKLDGIVEAATKTVARSSVKSKQSKKKKEYEFRTWTDNTGKYTIEAKYVSYGNRKVALERKDGSRTTLPMERLSPEDQEWVKGQWVK